ncbi:MAG: hypothetical protein ACK5MJ_08950 [Alphaproteobacteria bacterium]
MRLFYILSICILWVFSAFAEKPADADIQTAITEKSKYIQKLSSFKDIKETDNWFIFGYIATLTQKGIGPKNIYVYVPKGEDGLSGMKVRLHGFLPFPFPSVTYNQFRHFMNDSSALDELTAHLGKEAAAGFKQRFINSIQLDFLTDEGYVSFFKKEQALFEDFLQQYADKLEQIKQWNDTLLKAAKGNLKQSPPDSLLEDAGFAAYKNKIDLLGMDFVLPGVTGSTCTQCFMMVSGFTPSDNYSGFFWIKDENLLPPWDPNGVFFQQSLGGGWYIFHST